MTREDDSTSNQEWTQGNTYFVLVNATLSAIVSALILPFSMLSPSVPVSAALGAMVGVLYSFLIPLVR